MARDFLSLGVKKKLHNTLTEMGITAPTPVQVQAIPPLLTGKDIVAQAQTGTGKTFAFLLPILERVDVNKPSIQALIITPTRELALQITTELNKLADTVGARPLAVYGGQDVERQIKRLKGSIHIVVGTPGRILDHLRRGTISFSKVNMLVLDEADQMLHMGFLPEVEQIIKQTPAKRQTMLFSATMPASIRSLAKRYLTDPLDIKIESKRVILDEIKQLLVTTTDRAKQDTLLTLIEQYRPFMALIFCRTKRRAAKLNEALQQQGYATDELHGDLSQAKRERVMKRFREAQIQLLVATDVAARGLDVEGVTHVFNYDIPQDTESYIHRIGRTGRAGEKGIAITLAAPKDEAMLQVIEKGLGHSLEKLHVPNSKGKQEQSEQKMPAQRQNQQSRQGYQKRNKQQGQKQSTKESPRDKKRNFTAKPGNNRRKADKKTS